MCGKVGVAKIIEMPDGLMSNPTTSMNLRWFVVCLVGCFSPRTLVPQKIFFENNSRTIHTERLSITLTLLFHHLKSLENLSLKAFF